MKRDPLQAHARDELGITATLAARPLQAALASALSFATGAFLPLLAVILSPIQYLPFFVAISSLCFLATLGGIAARIGGANVKRGIVRVTCWSSLAMAVTAGVGTLFGVAV